MFELLVNEEGGLTTLGYGVCILLAAAALLLAAFLSGKNEKKTGRTKRLVFCAMSLAMGFLLSYVKLFHLPFGGAVTACSMLFIALAGYWYGPRTGLLTAFVYGMLQFLQGPTCCRAFRCAATICWPSPAWV